MEFRKLMAFGNSSYIVSVPKLWVEKNRLKKGDVLLVEEKPNELIFSAKDESERRSLNEATVNPEGKTFDEFKTEIISLYVNNYNAVHVINVRKPEEVKNIFRNLAGMEVVEETATKIVAKDLLDIQEVSLEKIIRRIDMIIRSMMTDSHELDVKNATSIIGRDQEVNRLGLLGFRTAKAATENPRLLKIFNTTYWNVMIAKQIITHQERFADQIKRIVRTLRDSKRDEKWEPEVRKLLKETSGLYNEIMKIYYDKNTQAAFRAETDIRKILKRCHALIEKHPNVTVSRLIEYFQHMVGSMKGILRNLMEYEN